MRALVALPVRSTDYWHEEAIVIHGDAEMRELIEAEGSALLAGYFDVQAWDSRPEQPVLMVADVRTRATGKVLGAVCRCLTSEEWAMVASGRVEELFR